MTFCGDGEDVLGSVQEENLRNLLYIEIVTIKKPVLILV
jgi:hypothetical protein